MFGQVDYKKFSDAVGSVIAREFERECEVRKMAELKESTAALQARRVLRVELASGGFEDFPGDAVYAVYGSHLHVYGQRGVQVVSVPHLYTPSTYDQTYPYYKDPLGHFVAGAWNSVRYVEKEN